MHIHDYNPIYLLTLSLSLLNFVRIIQRALFLIFLSEQSHPETRAQTKLRLKFKFKIKFSFLLLSLKYKSNILLLYNLLDAGRFFQLFVATVLKCKTRYTYFLFSDYDTISFEQTFFV